jgi:sulfatase maturation enzyme AslB (radical SAM superfamily)
MHIDVPDFVYAELDDMIRSELGFSHPSFCVLPFYAIEYPAKTPCCLLVGNNSLAEIKSQMLEGHRPNSCSKCWNLEDAGLKSDRQIKNETLDLFTNIDLEQLIEDCRQGKNKTIHYKIDTSNTCNSACMTCDGRASSTWNKLLKKNNLSTYKDWKILPDQTTDWIDYAHAKSILFRGGEPFLSDTNFYALEQLIEHGNTDCFVSFVTNGSFSLSRRQKELLSKFSNLNFCFSIDGIGPVFEYVRWPLKWDDIENNIAWCQANNIDVSVSYTLSNINLYYHTQTTQWFRDQKINYLTNPVYSPAHFRPESLSAEIKQQLRQQHNSDAISQWLAHSPNDDRLFEKFQVEIAKQDSMKNISMRDYLPELAALL